MKIVLSSAYQCLREALIMVPELAGTMRRADDFIRLAVVAAHQVLGVGMAGQQGEPTTTGLVLGSSFGTMQTNFDVLDFIVAGEQCSPTLFSHSVFNAAAGYIGASLNIQGSAMTVTDFSFPFFRALQQAMLAIAGGQLDRCLVLQVETYSQLLEDAHQQHQNNAPPWPKGVVCWLLEKSSGSVVGPCLEKVSIMDGCPEPLDCLGFTEELRIDGRSFEQRHPLGTAMCLTENLVSAATITGPVHCRVQGAWGEAVLQVNNS